METNTLPGGEQEPVQGASSQVSRKNKGGRPAGGPGYSHHRLNIYVTAEEFKLFMEFVEEGWYDQNASSAGRFLLSTALQEWQRKGRKKM